MSNNLHILSHPLVNTRLAKLRQVSTTPKEFREVLSLRVCRAQVSLSNNATGHQ